MYIKYENVVGMGFDKEFDGFYEAEEVSNGRMQCIADGTNHLEYGEKGTIALGAENNITRIEDPDVY